jgi:ATP-binding cassette subfamily B multidrug efflux pump
MREHLWSYLFGAIFLGLTLWMTFAIPRYLADVIDLLAQGANADVNSSPAMGSDPSNNVYAALLGWIVAFAIAIVVTRTSSRLLFFVPGRRIEFDLKNRLLAHLSTLQREYFLNNPSGAIISRMNNDINGVRMLLGTGIMMLLTSVGTLTLAPYYMYQISPRLTLYCALPVIAGFALLQIGIRHMRAQQVLQMSELQRLSEFTVESFSGVDVLKAFRTYGWAQEKFDGLSAGVRDASIRMSTVRAYFMPILLHITNMLKVMLLLVGGTLVIREGMSLGEFTAYMLYLSMLVPPLMSMTFLLFVLQRGFTGLTSLLSVFDTEPGRPAPSQDVRLDERLHLGLEVRGLTFAYADEPKVNVLEDISFAVGVGEVVGVFGSVGSGKSTLINLINGYLDAPPGTAFLDGIDTTVLGQAAVRAHVVTVAQEPFLFSDTINKNIALAVDDVDAPVLTRAVRSAALEPDLLRMPSRGETMVGEKGITLSGGQKQRVALARAALVPCDLLLLDDVLSAVDHETERFLIQQIYKFDNAASTLLVSHRISALQRADRIVVLHQGRLVDQGRHDELIGRPGPYADAWALQATGRYTVPVQGGAR